MTQCREMPREYCRTITSRQESLSWAIITSFFAPVDNWTVQVSSPGLDGTRQIESLIGQSGYRGQMDEYLNDLTDQMNIILVSPETPFYNFCW